MEATCTHHADVFATNPPEALFQPSWLPLSTRQEAFPNFLLPGTGQGAGTPQRWAPCDPTLGELPNPTPPTTKAQAGAATGGMAGSGRGLQMPHTPTPCLPQAGARAAGAKPLCSHSHLCIPRLWHDCLTPSLGHKAGSSSLTATATPRMPHKHRGVRFWQAPSWLTRGCSDLEACSRKGPDSPLPGSTVPVPAPGRTLPAGSAGSPQVAVLGMLPPQTQEGCESGQGGDMGGSCVSLPACAPLHLQATADPRQPLPKAWDPCCGRGAQTERARPGEHSQHQCAPLLHVRGP